MNVRDADRLMKVNRRFYAGLQRRVIGAEIPVVELVHRVGRGIERSEQRPGFAHALSIDDQHAVADGRAEPFMQARYEEIAAKLTETNGHLRERLRCVDDGYDAALPRKRA